MLFADFQLSESTNRQSTENTTVKKLEVNIISPNTGKVNVQIRKVGE